MTEHCKVSIMAPSPEWGRQVDGVPQIVTKSVTAAVSASNVVHSNSEVSVVLSDANELHVLNNEHRGVDAPTNVLSFPGDVLDHDEDSFTSLGRPMVLGDIVVAFEVIRDEAQAQGKAIEDHLAHMVVHGTLHLCGFDHETAKDAKEMEGLEQQILVHMGVANPFATATLKSQAKTKAKPKTRARPKTKAKPKSAKSKAKS